MIYFRFGTDGAYDGDDVKSHIAVDVTILDVVVHCALQALKLLVIYSLFGVAKETVAAGFDLDKYDGTVIVSGHDVDIAVPRLPVALYDGVAFALQIVGSTAFAPFA